jgi:three-Cys-motif partner protein
LDQLEQSRDDAMSDPGLYIGREQTLIKHFIFEKYLERFTHIVGFSWNSITYVDGFSGPWNAQSQDFKDSSFAIALQELRKAQETHHQRNKKLSIRCFFIEKDAKSFAQLEKFAAGERDAETDIQTFHGGFEKAIPQIVKFIKLGGPNTFPFIFIDPKGWTGYAMGKIAPLFQFYPVEVLINFQTGFISRFIELEETRENFKALYDSEEVRNKIRGLEKEKREDVAVFEYCASLKRVGNFSYVIAAIIPRPEINRTHFHLIYATRHHKGVVVFKDAEKRSIPIMHKVRADAQSRRRLQQKGQFELFPSVELYDESYLESLHKRFCDKAKREVKETLRTQRETLYDALWSGALSFPLVWEGDLRDWLEEWKKGGLVELRGISAKRRAPQLGQGILVLWKSQA